MVPMVKVSSIRFQVDLQ